MHHSVIQRQYSQKFTTWQETEKLSLSYIKLNNIELTEDQDVALSLSDKTYHLNNKLTYLSPFSPGRQDVSIKLENTFPPPKKIIVAFCKLKISHPSRCTLL